MPRCKNSWTIWTERQFTPSGSISYLFARRFKSAFWFCSLQSFRAWPNHQLACVVRLTLAKVCQSGSTKFAWRARKGFLVMQTLQFHLHTLVEPKFSSFLQITTLLIIWHSRRIREPWKGRWNIHCLPKCYEIFNFQYWMLPWNSHSPNYRSIRYFAIMAPWRLYREKSVRFYVCG